MNTTQKAVILSATRKRRTAVCQSAHSAENPLHSGAVAREILLGPLPNGILEFHQDQVLRKAYYTLVCKNCGRTFRCTMATLTGNSAAGPATMIIGSEETAMMDNFERREIERMYRDGYGPTAIADELGISRC